VKGWFYQPDDFVFSFNWYNLEEICEESSMKVYSTVAEDERCKPLSFFPKHLNYVRTYLSSFPGSGNTWVRHMIEQTSGIYTGSVYNDGALFSSGIFYR